MELRICQQRHKYFWRNFTLIAAGQFLVEPTSDHAVRTAAMCSRHTVLSLL